ALEDDTVQIQPALDDRGHQRGAPGAGVVVANAARREHHAAVVDVDRGAFAGAVALQARELAEVRRIPEGARREPAVAGQVDATTLPGRGVEGNLCVAEVHPA